MRRHASAYVNIPAILPPVAVVMQDPHTSAYVSIRQHTSAYVSIPAILPPVAEVMQDPHERLAKEIPRCVLKVLRY